MTYKAPSSIPFKEFVTLMAALISLTALAVDVMLPALHQIATELGSTNPNDGQFIISVLFIGLTIGQILYGPISDARGRKFTLFLAMSIFIVGCIVSIVATNFETMLFGRFLQGLGSAGPRIVVLAIIRDSHEGREMARVMSFIMSVFILVPAVAPALGELILQIANWNAIFLALILISSTTLTWFALRQKETLEPKNRRNLSFEAVKQATIETVKTPVSLGYTIVMGIIFGSFLGFLSTAQQILQIQYKLGEKFALYFAILALAFGGASLLNTKLVMKFGMRLLSRKATLALGVIALLFLPITWYFQGEPSIMSYMAYCMVSFFCVGIIFGNLTSIAMEPLGHIAGTATAVIGSLSTFISIPIGIIIGQFYTNTIYPIVISFGIVAFLALFIMKYTDKVGKKATQ